jgi:hypothetical protein
VHDSFQAAAIARNLVDNNFQWRVTMENSVQDETAFSIRNIFALICIHCNPQLPSPLELWTEFSQFFIADFIHRGDTPEVALNKALQHIDSIFLRNNTSCRLIGIPEPDYTMPMWNVNNLDYDAEQVDHVALAHEHLNNLTADQRNIYDPIILCIQNSINGIANRNNCYYVDGPGGCGKTYLISALIHRIRSLGQSVLSMAFTGIAASLIEDGTTIHYRYKFPVPTLPDSISNIRPYSPEGQLLRVVILQIYDEASMISKYILEAIDRTLKDILRNQLPFGGVTVLFCGDLRQCLPIVRNGNAAAICSLAITRSLLWQHFHLFQLTQNLRALPGEQEFTNWLLELGNGEIPRLDNEYLIRLPDRVVCPDNLIDHVFGPAPLDPIELRNTNKAILAPINDSVFEINENVLERLEGNTTTFYSIDEILADGEIEHIQIPIESIYQYTPPGYPKHEFNVKVGANVMLIKNLDITVGLCNGTRMNVIAINRHTIRCSIISGRFRGREHLIPRIVFRPDDDSTIKFTRIQFPFRLCFAMTINKSQGQTLDRLGIYLREPCFSHGQLYTAFSRARSFESVMIQVQNIPGGDKMQGEFTDTNGVRGIYTKNIVYPEIIQSLIQQPRPRPRV